MPIGLDVYALVVGELVVSSLLVGWALWKNGREATTDGGTSTAEA